MATTAGYDKSMKELFQRALTNTEVDPTLKKHVFDAIDLIKFMGEMTMVYSDTLTDSQMQVLGTIHPDDKPENNNDDE